MIKRAPQLDHPATGADARLLFILSTALLLARVAYLLWLTPYGLSPDEAQYISWLAHNDWSFLTKPPLTTWLAGLSMAVLGHNLVGVKIFALLGQVISAALAFAIAERAGGRAAGWWAWLAFTTAPIIAAGGLLMVPDAILLPFYLGALLMVTRATQAATPQQALCWPRWVGIGVLVGLAGLAKYSAAFFYPCLGLFMLGWRREWLKHPAPWVSGVIALALQTPVILWNLHNHWVGLGHVLWQADGGASPAGESLKMLSEFLASQLLLGPIVLLLILAAWGTCTARLRRLTAAKALLLAFSFPVFLGFTALSLHSKVQANWPLLGTVAGLILVGVWLAQNTPSRRWLWWLAAAAMALNALLGTMLMDTAPFRQIGLFPVKPKNDPTKDLLGWPQMGSLLGRVLQDVNNPVVLASRYQTLAPLMFHTPGPYQVAYINAEGRRLNEYDLWPLPDMHNRVVVYVSEQAALPPQIAAFFQSCRPWHKLAVEDHDTVSRRLSLWICINPVR